MKKAFVKFACACAFACTASVARAEGEAWGLVDAVYAGDAISAAEAGPFRPDVNAFSNPGGGNCKVTTYFGSSLTQDPTDWVPKNVYLTERYNLGATASTPLICTFADLTPNASYRLRYCGAETYFNATGKRVFKIVANGTVLEEGLDLVARTGGNFRAFAQDYVVTADADGRIAVSFEKGTVENPKYGGLALFGQNQPIISAPTAVANAEDGSKVDISCTARDAHSLTLQRAEAEEGPWMDVFTQFAGHRGTDVLTTSPASAVNWYRVIASNGVGTVTSSACRYEIAVQWGLVDAVYGHNNDYSLWPFRSDRDQVVATAGNGTLQCNKSGDINRHFVPDAYAWVPNDIFQIERFINAQSPGQELVNTFSGLNANAAYRLVYLAAETWKGQSGIRCFSMKVNGVEVLKDFDLYVASKAANEAYIQEFGVVSDAQGKITVSFTSTVNNGKYGGFLLYGNAAPLESGLSLDVKPLTGTNAVEAVFSAKSAHTCALLKSTASADGPWTEVTRVFSGAGAARHVDPVALNQDTWYCVTASNGLGCVTGAVSCVKKEYPVYSFNIGPEPDPMGDFMPCDFLDMAESDPTTYANEGISGMDDMAHPIPTALWNWSVYAKKFHFVLPNLRPDKTYTLRLYGVDTFATAAGVRVVKLYVNGVQTGDPIDFFARAGRQSKTLEYDYTGLAPAADGTLEIVLERTANYAQFAALQVVEENGEGVPLVPKVTGAYAGPGGVYVSIGSQTGGLTYEVRRRATGGDWTTLATNVTGGIWIDVGATGGCEYAARAVQADGATSDWSDAVGGTAAGDGPKTFLGGAAVAMTGARGEYRPLGEYSLKNDLGSSADTSSADWSAVREPLPSAARLQGVIGSSSSRLIQLTLKGLYPRANHLVRVHLSDVVSTAAGQRLISLYAGGRLFADHADLVAVNPVTRTAVFETCVCADATGTIHLYLNSQFTNVSSTPTLHGVEAILCAPDASAGAMTATYTLDTDPKGREIGNGALQTVALDWDADGKPAGASATNNVVIWSGRLTVPATADYTFIADQSGACSLLIDDTCVARQYTGGSAAVVGTIRLTAGSHRFRYRWGQWNDGPCHAQVRWSSPNLPEQVVGAPYLTHEPSVSVLGGKGWNLTELRVGAAPLYSGDAYVVGTNASGSAVWRIAASGSDVFQGTTQGASLYQWISGEFEMSLRVTCMDRFVTNTKGGVVIMDQPQHATGFQGDFLYGISSLAGGALMGSARRWEIFGCDSLPSIKSVTQKSSGNASLPLWLRVRRFNEGGAWKAGLSYSLDGETWAQESVYTLPHGGPVCVGPYFCAHTNAVNPLPCMEIDNVSLKVKGNCVIYIR